MERYTGKDGFKKIQEILRDRRERIARGLDPLRTNTRDRVRMLAAIGLAGLTLAGTNLTNNLRFGDRENADEQLGYDYVVTYDYTNAYSEVPDYNKIERVYEGDFIEFKPAEQGYYYEKDGKWEVGPVSDSITGTMWTKCEAVLSDKDGYLPSEYVEEYYPYKTIENADFLVIGDEESNEKVVDRTLNKQRVWLCQDYKEKYGESELYKVIIRDDDDSYIKGYMDINLLEKDTNKRECVGIMKSNTFLREYPKVTELDEKIILEQNVKNGEKIKVLEEVESGKEKWYKCEIEGREGEIYIYADATKSMDDFDEEITFSQIGGNITSKGGRTVRNTVRQGDKVKIDKDTVFNGSYQVMIDKDGISTVGYMDGRLLGLMQIDNSIKKKEKEIELVEKKEEKQDKLTYIMDLSDYSDYNAYTETMDDLLAKDMLGGVTFSIGGTKAGYYDDYNGVNYDVKIINFKDDSEEYENRHDDTILLDDGYKEMKEMFDGNIAFNSARGDIKNFERFVQAAIDRDLPVGFYYYQGGADANVNSIEAAYIYNVMNKIKNDMGEDFENADKLGIMIDVEDTYASANKDMERVEEIKELVKLMGHGTDNTNYKCINGVNPKDGYKLLDEYDNQFILYHAIMETERCVIQPESIEYLEKERQIRMENQKRVTT